MRKLIILSLSILCMLTTVISASSKPLTEKFKQAVRLSGKEDPNYLHEIIDDKWHLSSQKSNFDGSWKITLQLGCESEEENEEIFIQCNENKTYVFFVADGFHGECFTTIEYRIDGSKTKRVRGGIYQGVIGMHEGKMLPFIRELLNKKTLAIRVSSCAGERIERVFNIEGIESAIAPIARECNWKIRK